MRAGEASAAEIAETLLNGNLSDARNAIVKGRTPKGAALAALDVADELAVHLEDHCAALRRVRRLIDPHGETTT